MSRRRFGIEAPIGGRVAVAARASGRWLVRGGSATAIALTAHSLLNSRLLRTAPPSDASAPPAPDAAAPPGAGRRVSVLIPARDEEARIGACLESLRGQAGVSELIVLDDQSTDGTADIIAGYAPMARRIDGSGPPDGWLGKPAACAALAEAADPRSDVLVFLDADVVLEPDAIRRAVALLDRLGLDLICPYPRQIAVTAAERLVQPLLQWSWLTFLPLRIAERSGRPSLGAANGQFLVVRAAAYRRAGGHGAARDAVLEDLALLRAVKAAGGRGGVADGSDLASCRMYDDTAALVDGYAKSLWSAFGSGAGAAAVAALLAATYLAPPAAMLAGSRAGAAGFLAAVAGRVACARRTRGRAWPDAAAHPASIGALIWLCGVSFARRRRGTLAWRGRSLAGLRAAGRGGAR